jgi:superfamily II DNA or RNA helicase
MLRKHQAQFASITDRIILGSAIRTIYCHVTPGGGKSLIPILGGKLITKGLADRLIWIAPRLSLVDQAEREFINPYFRQTLGHNLQIRSSTNEPNPCRGLNGFSTTYNAVGMDDGTLVDEFSRRRYILILDEFHHIQEGSLWHQKIKPLWDLAEFRVAFTGTLERGDNSKIAFLPYRIDGNGFAPDLQEGPETAVVRYTRRDALEEKAIIPLSFHLTDGQAEWEEVSGDKFRVSSLDKMTDTRGDMIGKALYTALKTEYANELLRSGISHWQTWRTRAPSSSCLVVTANIEEARRHTETLKSSGIAGKVEIATSSDSKQAMTAIKKLKSGKLDSLVTVAMAYEGLSVPAVSHIVCLTRIRSTSWIEQMTARANRIDPDAGPYENQIGHVFAPADPLFKKIVAQIEEEQAPILEMRKKKERKELSSSNDSGTLFPIEQTPFGIRPLSSSMTGQKQVVLAANSSRDLEKTASEIESELKQEIENHIRSYAQVYGVSPHKINGEILQTFGKARSRMTIGELRRVASHIESRYPMAWLRKSGTISCTWR